jgi:hypothetical protein
MRVYVDFQYLMCGSSKLEALLKREDNQTWQNAKVS